MLDGVAIRSALVVAAVAWAAGGTAWSAYRRTQVEAWYRLAANACDAGRAAIAGQADLRAFAETMTDLTSGAPDPRAEAMARAVRDAAQQLLTARETTDGSHPVDLAVDELDRRLTDLEREASLHAMAPSDSSGLATR